MRSRQRVTITTEQEHNMSNQFATIATLDQVLDMAGEAPMQYATELTQLVSKGYAELLPMSKAGRASAEVQTVKDEIMDAYKSAGVSNVSARRKRVLRLTYALHILSANPKREEETEDNYVKRVSRIRAIANGGDLDTVNKAIKGASPRKARPDKPAKAASKKSKATETEPETDKEQTPSERYELAQNALVKAMSEYMDAVDAFRKDGKRMSKASVQQVTARAHQIVSMLSA
jgi:hypothetical protein